MDKYTIAGIVAALIFLSVGAFALGQRATSYNFLGLSGTCIDTTVHH